MCFLLKAILVLLLTPNNKHFSFDYKTMVLLHRIEVSSTSSLIVLHTSLLQGNRYICLFAPPDASWLPSGIFFSCLVLFYCCYFPHTTPPYRFHSNAFTEMTIPSRCYHSSLSSVHIWRLSSSQEHCSLQQTANCGAGGVGGAYYVVQRLRTTLLCHALRCKGEKFQKKFCRATLFSEVIL